MSDFYPVLARAVSRLPIDGSQARQEVYDHARTFLFTQLRGQEPRRPALEIMHEQIALEAAIRKVEAQSQAHHSQPLKELTSRRLTANHAAVPDAGMTPQPSIDHDSRIDAFRDRMGLRTGKRHTAETEPAHQSFVNDRTTADEGVFESISEIVEQFPSDMPVTRRIENSIAHQNRNGTSVRMVEPSRDRSIRHDRSATIQSNFAKAPASEKISRTKKSAFLDPTIMGLVCIVALLGLIAVISIPVATIYIPRLVWASQHLMDNPMLLVAFLTVLGLTLLLFVPIFGGRRKQSAIGSLWLFVYSILRREY